MSPAAKVRVLRKAWLVTLSGTGALFIQSMFRAPSSSESVSRSPGGSSSLLLRADVDDGAVARSGWKDICVRVRGAIAFCASAFPNCVA